MNINEVKSKIAKLLRLQTSTNVGEATNAAAFVEKLCVKYNISSTDCKEYDPDKDEVVEFKFGKSYQKANIPEQNLIHGVTKYFNGQTIITHAEPDNPWSNKRIMKVIASKGNQIQIELYLEYLIETMNKLSDKAKKSGAYGTQSSTYKNNWKKGFSKKIADRLIEMKIEQNKIDHDEVNEPALVIANKNSIELKATRLFLEDKYPNRPTRKRRHSAGVGYSDGRSKAESVGLHKQTSGNKTLALTGK